MTKILLYSYDLDKMKLLEKSITFSVIVILVFSLYLYGVYAYSLFKYPFEVDIAEGNLLNHAVSLKQDGELYTDFNQYPMRVLVYGPVYPLIVSLFIPFFGNSLIIGRLISFTSTILIAFLIFKIVREETRDNKIALISSSLYFPTKSVTLFTLFRVDSLATLLSVASFYFASKYKEKRLNLWFSMGCLLAAIYSKQTSIFALFAILLFLFLEDKRNATGYLLTFSFISLFIFFTIDYISDGWFHRHMFVQIHMGNVSFSASLGLLFHYVRFFYPFVVIGIVHQLHFLFEKKRMSLWFIFFLSTTIFLVITTLSTRGNHYLFPVIAATCIIFGIGMKYIFDKKIPVFNLGVLMTIFFAIIMQIASPGALRQIFYSEPTDESLVNNEVISRYVRETRGRVFNNEHVSFNLRNGKRVWINLGEELVTLHKVGKWNSSKALKDIKKKRFSLIIGSSPVDVIQNAIEHNYKVKDIIKIQSLDPENYWSNLKIYEPK